MPIVSGVNLPIRKIKITGRAVDLHEARKESDDAQPITASDLRRSIDLVKNSIFAAIKMLRRSGS